MRIVAAYSAMSTKSQNSGPAHAPVIKDFARSRPSRAIARSRKNMKLVVGVSARRAAEISMTMLMPPQRMNENQVSAR